MDQRCSTTWTDTRPLYQSQMAMPIQMPKAKCRMANSRYRISLMFRRVVLLGILRRSFAVVSPGAADGFARRQQRHRDHRDCNGVVINRGSVAIDGRESWGGGHRRGDAPRGFAAATRSTRPAPSSCRGLVNTTPRPDGLFRGLADDLALMDWLQSTSSRPKPRPCRRSSSAPGHGWPRSG